MREPFAVWTGATRKRCASEGEAFALGLEIGRAGGKPKIFGGGKMWRWAGEGKGDKAAATDIGLAGETRSAWKRIR